MQPTVKTAFESESTECGIETPSLAIAEAIAETLNRDVTEIAPLAQSIDPDALDRVIQSAMAKGGPDVRFEFGHEGCQITVMGGEITVSSAETAPVK